MKDFKLLPLDNDDDEDDDFLTDSDEEDGFSDVELNLELLDELPPTRR